MSKSASAASSSGSRGSCFDEIGDGGFKSYSGGNGRGCVERFARVEEGLNIDLKKLGMANLASPSI